jgi:hypothetical protein
VSQLVALAMALAVTTSAMSSTAAAADRDTLDRETLDRIVFELPIAAFPAVRAAGEPASADWRADGCSTPLPVGLGDTGRSFDFTDACNRHDFAYRNYKLLGVFTADIRARVDRRFLADMRADCARRPWTQRYACRVWAQTYYRAVRLFAGP